MTRTPETGDEMPVIPGICDAIEVLRGVLVETGNVLAHLEAYRCTGAPGYLRQANRDRAILVEAVTEADKWIRAANQADH